MRALAPTGNASDVCFVGGAGICDPKQPHDTSPFVTVGLRPLETLADSVDHVVRDFMGHRIAEPFVHVLGEHGGVETDFSVLMATDVVTPGVPGHVKTYL